MNDNTYQKLKGDVKDKGFYTKYKGLMKFMWYASFVANGFGILFAYFHLNKVIEQAVDPTNSILLISILTICVLILTGLEYLKRFVFNEFSAMWISNKFGFKGVEMGVLAFVSIFLIVVSFYLSVHGAAEYAAKSDTIKNQTEATIESKETDISNTYDKKIAVLDSTNMALAKLKMEYDGRAESAATNRDKTYYRNQVKEQQALIEKNEEKVKELKKERDAEIEKTATKITSKADETLKSNEGNSMRFLIFSTIIELFILIGIFFKNLFNIKSVREYEEISRKDPRYRNLVLYNGLIDIIYKKDSQIGDALPYKTEVAKMLKLNQVDLIGKDLDDTLKIFTHLGIVQLRGSKRILKMDKEEAKVAIKEYLKIE
jgi:hypothetical protein